MPKAILDKLPVKAREIYESAWKEAKDKNWDDERAARYAIGAVKQAGFRKNTETERWSKMGAIHTSFSLPVYLSEWLEVACTGSVTDMNGNGVSITDRDLDEWILAYDEQKRGQDLPITYDHPKSGGVAAGWVRGLKKGPTRDIMGKPRTTLLMKPEWTENGKKSVQDRDYQYFSVEILPDNQLRAVSLVNFPAIKGMYPATQPVTLGEGPVFLLKEFLMAEEDKKSTKKLGDKCPECGAPVPEGAKACPACGADLGEKEKEMADKKDTLSEERLSELQAQLTQLQEERTNLSAKLKEVTEARETEGAEVTSLAEKVAEQERQITGLIELNNMLRLHEKVGDFMQLEEIPNRQITPAYEEPITKVILLAEGDIDKEGEILDLLKALASGSAVFELGELGTSAIPNSKLADGPDLDHAKLHEAAVKLQKEQNISYSEALIEASKKERG